MWELFLKSVYAKVSMLECRPSFLKDKYAILDVELVFSKHFASTETKKIGDSMEAFSILTYNPHITTFWHRRPHFHYIIHCLSLNSFCHSVRRRIPEPSRRCTTWSLPSTLLPLSIINQHRVSLSLYTWAPPSVLGDRFLSRHLWSRASMGWVWFWRIQLSLTDLRLASESKAGVILWSKTLLLKFIEMKVLLLTALPGGGGGGGAAVGIELCLYWIRAAIRCDL